MKKVFAYSVFVFLFVELSFQLMALFGLLPNVNIAENVPYGRVYWTREGKENSVMNNYGWHYKNFDLVPSKERIVLIGDSFVEALQVSKEENIGQQLENTINKLRPSANVEVISLGRANTGPAQYLEMIKYAVTFLKPKEIIVLTYIGNDFRNVDLQYKTPPTSPPIYYELSKDSVLVIDSANSVIKDQFYEGMIQNHNVQSTRFIKSHFLTYKIIRTLLQSEHNTQEAPKAKTTYAELSVANLNAFAFSPGDSIKFSMVFSFYCRLIKECHDICKKNNMNFHMVTIPVFTESFYIQKITNKHNWSFSIGELDLSIPERKLNEFGSKEGLSILKMGEYLKQEAVSVDSIQHMFFFKGTRHFTAFGHKYFANAIFKTFYSGVADVR